MNDLLAATPGGITSLQWMASGAIGLAVLLLVRWITDVLSTEDLQQGDEWRYDVSRINELRRIDPFYRLFQPAIRGLARFNRGVFRESLPEVQRQIQAAGLPRFWLAEEYLAKCEILGLFAAPVFAYYFVDMFGLLGGLIATLIGTLLSIWVLRRRLASRAARRLLLVKRRIPYLLDLLTLLMEAGSTLLGAMTQAVEEFQGHPVAEEFGRVLSDMNLGKTRTEAFQAMRDRLDDDEITAIISSILQGESFGTPLANVFRTQADVLRMKRSQRAEAVAGEAGVNMLLPGILVMMATVLIIVGPFLMNYLKFGFGMSG
ncbi:MAG: type II secretion system F family protein [Planctomycetes bacterium]|nr:type II secretion system F family protein [Planctomycetota bacterium]